MHRGLATVICMATTLTIACLKSGDEIEIIDSSLGVATPTVTTSPTGTPKAASFVAIFLSDLAGYLALSAADGASLKTAGEAGINDPFVTGLAATPTLVTLIQNSVAWLKSSAKLPEGFSGRTDVAYKILVSGYTAVDEIAKVGKVPLEAVHLRAIARSLGDSYADTFAPTVDDFISSYALFSSGAIAAAMLAVTTDLTLALTADETLLHSSILVGEMAGSAKEQATRGTAANFTQAYCREIGGIVVTRIAGTDSANRALYSSSYVTAILESLAQVPGYVPDAGRQAACENAMAAGIAAADQAP